MLTNDNNFQERIKTIYLDKANLVPPFYNADNNDDKNNDKDNDSNDDNNDNDYSQMATRPVLPTSGD